MTIEKLRLLQTVLSSVTLILLVLTLVFNILAILQQRKLNHMQMKINLLTDERLKRLERAASITGPPRAYTREP